jgi:hypothetical protein
MISTGTTMSSAKKSVRVPSSVASAMSSMSVCLTVDHAVPLMNRGAADGLRQMTLASAWRPQEEGVFALQDEADRGEVVDEGAIHRLVEIEIKGVERAVGIVKAGLLEPACDEPLPPADQFVAVERRDEIDGRLFSDCAWRKRGLERVGYAREAEFPERVIESTRFMSGLLSADR